MASTGNLDGTCIALTGATDGIGLETAELLSREGARLVLHGRRDQRLREVAASVGAVGMLLADFSSLAEVRRLVDRLEKERVDVLVNNAGAGPGSADERELSRDGHELRLQVNFLAPFALTEWLIAAGSCPPVVVNVASIGQEPVDLEDLMLERQYGGWLAYRRSKLALIAWSFDLAERHADLCVNALHPGTLLDTKMVRESDMPVRGRPQTGARAIRHVVLEGLAGKSGGYYDVQELSRAKPQAYDHDFRARLRRRAIELVQPLSRGLVIPA
jgi:NAD(P)-dependent dehydrogenase (short-subunit alcohol dehydrogenase family)